MTDETRGPTPEYMEKVSTALFERRPELKVEHGGLDADAALIDIGIDSFSVVELLISFAEQYNADMEAAFEGAEPPVSVGDLAVFVERIATGVTQ